LIEKVPSEDGTAIAFERSGQGPALVVVAGAGCDRTAFATLGRRLASRFCVYRYDRRGRGASGAGPGCSVEAEVADLAAVVSAAGGRAAVFGHSSGAILSLEAALRAVPITRLALYEPPFIVDRSRPLPGARLADRLADLAASGRHGEAVELFWAEGVGLSPATIARLKSTPTWAATLPLAGTLSHDVELCGEGCELPRARYSGVTVPTLAIDGEASPTWVHNAVVALAGAIPGARHLRLAGQSHVPEDESLAPVLEQFLS
jgi:pimeloyl-ACP methyl ester carboxylesterase